MLTLMRLDDLDSAAQIMSNFLKYTFLSMDPLYIRSFSHPGILHKGDFVVQNDYGTYVVPANDITNFLKENKND